MRRTRSASFRAAGIPLPSGTTSENVERLGRAIDRTHARHVVFLGDFLHSAEGRAAHTLERFRTCFYRPLLSSTENFERWKSKGGRDAAARAGEIWRQTLAAYEQPPMDPGLRAELEAYVARRRAELGD